MTDPHLSWQWVPTPSSNDVFSYWKSLTDESDNSLFTSLGWLQAWLNNYVEPDWMLLIFDQSELVSASLWCEKYHKRPWGFHSRTLHLQHTGDEELDQIWPEYNGLLCKPAYKAVVYPKLFSRLFNSHPHIDEIDTGLMLTAQFQQLTNKRYINEETISLNTYIYRAIDAFENNGFSRGLRAEINRTERGLQELSANAVDAKFERDRVHCWQQFLEMEDLHVQTWGDTSGFLNERFRQFHESLITQPSDDVKPLMVSIIVNGTLLGRHYLLQHETTLYFYLGVTNKEVGKRIKVGTYLHAKTIEKLASLDCKAYDFLGGDYTYKKRMATQVLPLCRVRVKKKSAKSQLEKTLKRLKQKVEGVTQHE